MYFDSHAHYDDAAFDTDRAELLAKLPLEGVGKIANMGCDIESSRKAVELAAEYDYIYAAVGIHPGNADDFRPEMLDEIRKLARSPKVVAIGEIGLDYHHETPDREAQRALFRAQLALAEKLSLPVCIHDRDAHAESMEIIREFPNVHGVFHCYAGAVQMMRELVELGWYIGFTGIVSFGNSRKIKKVAFEIPEDRILIETDCPYLAPEPLRGQRCDSSMLKYTGAAIAAIRGVLDEDIYNASYENACRLYNIK